MMIASGRIQIQKGVRIITNLDFCKYYLWLINKYYCNTIKLQLPAYGAHVSIIIPSIHGVLDYAEIQQYDNKIVDFEYFPEKIYRSPVNFWIPVKCYAAEEIRKKLNIAPDPNDWGLHLTIANTKFQKSS